MRKKVLPLAIAFFLMGLVIDVRAAIAGPRLYFEPASGNYDQNSEFTVTVKIDTGGKEAMTADALINFDNSKLTVVQVTNGGFFSGFDYNVEDSNGRLTIYAFSEQPLQTKSGVGDLAVITFKGVAEGTASVSFLCQAGNDTDSAIWDAQGNDLIDCAANGSGSYTVGTGDSGSDSNSSITPTPTETESAPEAPTPTPSQLPETGFEAPLLILGVGGGIMLLLGLTAAL